MVQYKLFMKGILQGNGSKSNPIIPFCIAFFGWFI